MKARYADPPKTEADRHEIRMLIRSQLVELKGDAMVWCAECKRKVPVRCAYHCYNCGLWLCHACSVIHFAPSQAPTKQLAADQRAAGQKRSAGGKAMKAISLWQPWATAIALGAKRVETRSWPTAYRGPLLIHAAKRRNIGELIQISSTWYWHAALRPLNATMGAERKLWDVLPFGAIVAVCELVDCRPTSSFTGAEIDEVRHPDHEDLGSIDAWTECYMGDFTPGRWGWVLSGIQPLTEPIPHPGRQGLFDVPDAVVARLTEQLSEHPEGYEGPCFCHDCVEWGA
jgi:hypothetical protein